jgi:hypothetical protein
MKAGKISITGAALNMILHFVLLKEILVVKRTLNSKM